MQRPELDLRKDFIELQEYDPYYNIDHYNRIKLLSDYWYGYLSALKTFKINIITNKTLKFGIYRDCLYNALLKGYVWDYSSELCKFYVTNKRSGINEIKKYKKFFEILVKWNNIFEFYGSTQEIILQTYYTIRKEFEQKNEDWTLYKVFNHKQMIELKKVLEKHMQEESS